MASTVDLKSLETLVKTLLDEEINAEVDKIIEKTVHDATEKLRGALYRASGNMAAIVNSAFKVGCEGLKITIEIVDKTQIKKEKPNV